jgi:hypothetical protein
MTSTDLWYAQERVTEFIRDRKRVSFDEIYRHNYKYVISKEALDSILWILVHCEFVTEEIINHRKYYTWIFEGDIT